MCIGLSGGLHQVLLTLTILYGVRPQFGSFVGTSATVPTRASNSVKLLLGLLIQTGIETVLPSAKIGARRSLWQ